MLTREQILEELKAMAVNFPTLAEHINELIERAEDEEAALVRGDIEIHEGRFQVRVAGRIVEELTATEFRLLLFLAKKPGWVYPRSRLIEELSGDCAITERAIDVQIVGLRRKLGEFSNYIQTVRGVGYRFKEIDNA